MLTKIIKRDGREVNFSIEKIANAIFKAAQSMGGKDYEESLALANQGHSEADGRAGAGRRGKGLD